MMYQQYTMLRVYKHYSLKTLVSPSSMIRTLAITTYFLSGIRAHYDKDYGICHFEGDTVNDLRIIKFLCLTCTCSFSAF